MFCTSHAHRRLVLSTTVVNGRLVIHDVGPVHSCTNTANSCPNDSCHIFISVFKPLTPNFNFSRSPFLFFSYPRSQALMLRDTNIEIMQVWRAWYSFFSHDHEPIEIGQEQKGNVLCVVQPTMCSTFSVYDIHPPIGRQV